MEANARRQFETADRAVMRAAGKIERAVADLFARTDPLERVAHAYVVERLASLLLERNPGALDEFKYFKGEATVQLTNALMDWRDQWGER